MQNDVHIFYECKCGLLLLNITFAVLIASHVKTKHLKMLRPKFSDKVCLRWPPEVMSWVRRKELVMENQNFRRKMRLR